MNFFEAGRPLSSKKKKNMAKIVDICHQFYSRLKKGKIDELSQVLVKIY